MKKIILVAVIAILYNTTFAQSIVGALSMQNYTSACTAHVSLKAKASITYPSDCSMAVLISIPAGTSLYFGSYAAFTAAGYSFGGSLTSSDVITWQVAEFQMECPSPACTPVSGSIRPGSGTLCGISTSIWTNGCENASVAILGSTRQYTWY